MMSAYPLPGSNVFAGFYSIANGIDHAVPKINGLVENDDFRVPIVIVKAGGIGPPMAWAFSPGHNIHHMPAVLIDDLEKFLIEFCVAIKLLGIYRHCEGRLSENALHNVALALTRMRAWLA